MNETTEAKLRKVLDTKARLKTSINNKGGTITDDTPFDEYPTQVDNISAGGGSVQIVQPEVVDTLVAVPNTGTINKICFNINLSNEEVVEIINNANLNFVDNKYYVVVTSGGETLTGEIQKVEDVVNGYMITFLGGFPLWISKEVADDGGIGLYGWLTQDKNPEFLLPANGIFPLSEAIEVKPTHNGQIVGEQNEALRHLVYCDGGIYETGNMEVVKELSGQYLAETQTITPEKTTTYNIFDMIGEKVENKTIGNLLISDENTNVQGIYFNTSLTPTEVADILSKLLYKSDPNILDGIPFYIAYANPNLSRCIAIVGMAGMYMIADGNFFTMEMTEIFVHSPSEGISTWTIADKYFSMNNEVGVNYIEQLQINIGDQNDKLTSLISMNNDFELKEIKTKVFPKNVRVDINGFVKPSGTIDITKNDSYDVSQYATANVNINTNTISQTITPSKTEQTITPPNGYIGFSKIKVEAVTSSIDSKILPENIKEGVFILGVRGTYNNPLYITNSQITEIGDYAFYGLSNLETYHATNENFTKIGNSAFENCKSLLALGVKKLTSIGDRAFYDCRKLMQVTLPSNIETIGFNAYRGCEKIERVYFTGTLDKWCNIRFKDSFSNPLYYAGLLYLQDENGEFYYIDEISIPNNVTEIKGNAFIGSTSLRSVTTGNGVTLINGGAFERCERLESVTIGNSVISISPTAFDTCSALENITIDESNPKYDSRNNCNAIIETSTNTLIGGCKNTIIPNSVTGIGASAFGGRELLTSITIPNSVIKIDLLAFYRCISLANITIPSSVTKIATEAFADCSSLVEVDMSALTQVPEFGEFIFNGCYSLTTIKVPSALLNDFKTAPNMTEYANLMVGV